MSSDFLIVHKKILPDYLEKVIQARELLETREATTIIEATQMVGISRNTYYKYKDYVFKPESQRITHRAVISLLLKDVAGSLSAVIQRLSQAHTSILTISQAVPVAGKANVMISLDITEINCTIDVLLLKLKEIKAVRSAHLDAMD